MLKGKVCREQKKEEGDPEDVGSRILTTREGSDMGQRYVRQRISLRPGFM